MKTTILLPLAMLAGCVSSPLTVHDPVEVHVAETEYIPVPEGLLTPCRVELGNLDVNEDMEKALAAALLELERCTGDKNAIRNLGNDDDSVEGRSPSS